MVLQWSFCCNFSLMYGQAIIPALCLMLSKTYYAQNYAGIIGLGLAGFCSHHYVCDLIIHCFKLEKCKINIDYEDRFWIDKFYVLVGNQVTEVRYFENDPILLLKLPIKLWIKALGACLLCSINSRFLLEQCPKFLLSSI